MKVHHVGILVSSLEEGREEWVGVSGGEVVSEPVIDPVQKVRVQFLRLPEHQVIELIEPLGEDSPAMGALERGHTYAHICFEVDDLEQAMEEAKSKGAVVIKAPEPAVAFDMRRIAFLFFRHLGVAEYLERETSP